MDLKGIEPLSLHCKCRILPLNERPILNLAGRARFERASYRFGDGDVAITPSAYFNNNTEFELLQQIVLLIRWGGKPYKCSRLLVSGYQPN